MYVTTKLLRFRRDHPSAFSGGYRPLEAEGEAADHLVAFARHAPEEDTAGARSDVTELVVLATRFPATLEREGGWRDTTLVLPAECRGGGWRDALSGAPIPGDEEIHPDALPLGLAVLYR